MIAASLVTVKIADSKKQFDMELPADMPVRELAPKLLAALKSLDGGIAYDVERIRLKLGERRLTDEETLSSAHIWDGGSITVERSV